MADQDKEHLSYIINQLGEDRAHYFNAIAPPIMQTSNFEVNTIDELRQKFKDEFAGYLYSRGINPTVDILRKKLAALDGAEDCLVFNNGAAAIFAAVLANVKAGDHIVSVSRPYTWVQKMFDVILPRFGVSTTYVDGRDAENYFNATKPNTSFYYLESPNSWDFALQDISAIAAYARSKNIITLIDNSYCTPLYQQPIGMGIDMSMQTATKYIGGHSDTLGGVLTGTHAMMKKIFDSEYLNIGSGIQPFNAWLLLRGLRTLPARLDRISASTRKVVDYLKGHPKIENVLFPLDESFPQYELACRQMKGACGLITIIVRTDSVEKIEQFCEGLNNFFIAVSWGGYESLVIPKVSSIERKDFDVANPEHRMIRLYIGLEDPAFLIEDLNRSFQQL
jgi:cystathionine beta-lyase/cystathionine gamma-synthase